MDIEVVVRLALLICGLIFILIAAGGAIVAVVTGGGKVTAQGVGSIPFDGITKVTEAITALIKGLTAAPVWLACAAIGFGLILMGFFMPISL